MVREVSGRLLKAPAGIRRPLPVPKSPVLCERDPGPPRRGTLEPIEDEFGDPVQGNPSEGYAF